MKRVSSHAPQLEQGLLEEMLGALITIRPDGVIVGWNTAAEALFGYSADEAIGRTVFETIVPLGQEKVKREWLEATEATGAIAYEGLRRRKDGLPVHVDVVSRVLRDAKGTRYIVLNERDTTPIKYRRQAQLLEARFSGVVEAVPDAILLVDRGGRIALLNPEAERLFGYARGELIGQPVDLLVPERFRGHHASHRAGYFADPHPRPMGSGLDLWGRRKDGSEFPVEISLSPVRTEEGTMVTAAIRDVSERISHERKRRETSELELRKETAARRELQEYIDAMSTLNVKVSPGGTILLVNRIAQTASGRSLDELLGTPFDAGPWWSWDEAVHDRVVASFAKAKAGDAVTLEDKLRLFGAVVPVSLTLVPIAGPSGEVAYIVAEARDISQLAEAEQSLRAANQELEAFTYSVSHDLRAPLRQIDGFSKVLREQLGTSLDEKTEHYLMRIQEGTRHMGHLVDDLLYMARVGRQEVRLWETSLDVLVREIIASLLPEVGSRSIEWQIASLPAVECDVGLMRVAFTNLLSNAVKYTRPLEHAVIEVGFLSRPGAPVFFVRDNGVGFNMKYADKLFGVFQRLHRHDQFEGTGVGLATVQRIVYKHGGAIWAEAAVDEGATFYFTLRPSVDAGARRAR